MPRRPDQPGLWTPREDDLPPDAILAREPLLAGLGENAIYRLMLLRHRKARPDRPTRVIPLIATYWSFILLLIHIVDFRVSAQAAGVGAGSPLAWLLPLLPVLGAIVGGIIGLAIVRLIQGRGRAFKRSFIAAFQLDETMLKDLRLTAADPRDFAHAIWGAGLSRRRLRLRASVLGAWLAIAGGMLLWAAPRALPGEWILWLLFALLLVGAGQTRTIPWVHLSLRARQAAAFRSLAERRRFSARFRPRPPLRLIRTVLLAAAFIAAMFLVASNYGAIYQLAPIDLSLVSGRALLAAAIALAGPALGAWRGRYLRLRADANFRSLTDDFRYILNWLEDEANAEHGARKWRAREVQPAQPVDTPAG